LEFDLKQPLASEYKYEYILTPIERKCEYTHKIVVKCNENNCVKDEAIITAQA